MDPTKSFDHLDPKLKETYARVMGTTPTGSTDPAQSPAGQPAPVADPTLSASPSVFNPPAAAADPNQNIPSLDPTLSPSLNGGPNPGTGPTVSSMADESPTFSPPPATLSPAEPTPDPNAPAASPFFSNPTPAATEPPQPGGTVAVPTSEPSTTPVTPYSPDNAGAPVSSPTEQYAQPLPSPSSVAQAAPHQASALLRVLYIIGAAIFFSIYTVFWIKVFNLPFLF